MVPDRKRKPKHSANYRLRVYGSGIPLIRRQTASIPEHPHMDSMRRTSYGFLRSLFRRTEREEMKPVQQAGGADVVGGTIASMPR